LIKLLSGKNTGKVIVKVAQPQAKLWELIVCRYEFMMICSLLYV
jgi:hypothetical protein